MKLSTTQRDVLQKMKEGAKILMSRYSLSAVLEIKKGTTKAVKKEDFFALLHGNMIDQLMVKSSLVEYVLSDAGLKALKETE